mmetsp:Transcript_4978/g.5813  ORF Transcript_4978/g.5813 Transcript_4978/m.5813 type:complete len:423 (-) Transcript_4978:593-1861(-)|eukprot:CAMPEP_0197845610 /NCGR_PEP_ID=MMETSP1438-20131217/2524_1 /TAXON_ID=1461541 /ORGANISM="Pterosperma sp., Strain CCMP1384" /LENGTH=422 /DNA_ID=CAMNT_0043456977 /DNA_START=282 /DNA_END=1550 /DNA_ORIENTATION=+
MGRKSRRASQALKSRTFFRPHAQGATLLPHVSSRGYREHTISPRPLPRTPTCLEFLLVCFITISLFLLCLLIISLSVDTRLLPRNTSSYIAASTSHCTSNVPLLQVFCHVGAGLSEALSHWWNTLQSSEKVIYRSGSITVVDDGYARSLMFFRVLETQVHKETGKSLLDYNHDIVDIVSEHIADITNITTVVSRPSTPTLERSQPSTAHLTSPTSTPDPGHPSSTNGTVDLDTTQTNPNPAVVVILGVGGGGIFTELLSVCDRCRRIIGVDKDPEVLDIQKRFFKPLYNLTRWDERVRLVEEDAVTFMGEGWNRCLVPLIGSSRDESVGETRVAAVVNDVYRNSKVGDMPQELTTYEFMKLVSSRLLPGGLYTVNMWGDIGSHRVERTRRRMRDVFENVRTVKSMSDGDESNWVITGYTAEQ